MAGPRGYHTKCSQTEKDKYHVIPLNMENQKNDANEFTKQKETHRHQETNLLPKGINEELRHNYCICEKTTKICCTAQGTVLSIL